MYVMPQICSKLEQLIQMKTHELNNREFITNLLFYIMVLSSTVFMLPWNLYLRRLNIKINQTIQILNIIPMVLIPIYRKETRDFLKWVVFMASQCEEGDDSEEAHQG
jgi:NADH:ubiquinone oxidoreductase subunit 3 (subunit A)